MCVYVLRCARVCVVTVERLMSRGYGVFPLCLLVDDNWLSDVGVSDVSVCVCVVV